MRALWCLIVPLAVAGAILNCIGNRYENPIMTAAIILGTCVALNLPMFLAAIIEDACDNRLLTFFAFVFFAPFTLIWNWFSTLISLLKGRSGTDWIGGNSGGGNNSNGGGNGGSRNTDNRSSDNSLLFNAMERAISSVRYDSSNYPDGSYVRVARKDVNYIVTRFFGIKIYGTVTYELTNYNMSQYDYENDINDALEQTTNNLSAAAEEAAQGVREKYKGYDCEWNIEVELQGKVKG